MGYEKRGLRPFETMDETQKALDLYLRVQSLFFFKQKTAYEVNLVTGVQTCALPI